ncbi:MAG: hypothetical protein HUU04_10255 [Verrucomicrobiae bacterium]|nr:hypothetical protein [Verrucomicrobiae bacterium]
MRETDSGKSIVEGCQEMNISEMRFHRWKQQFGQIDINEARRLKDLERGNVDLKIDAGGGSFGQARLGGGMRKNGKPGASSADGDRDGPGEAMFRACGVPNPWVVPGNFLVSGKAFVPAAGAVDPVTAGALGEASSLRDRRIAALFEHTRECRMLWGDRTLKSSDGMDQPTTPTHHHLQIRGTLHLARKRGIRSMRHPGRANRKSHGFRKALHMKLTRNALAKRPRSMASMLQEDPNPRISSIFREHPSS